MLKEVDERGLGGDKTRLEYGIEKRVCCLFCGWMRVRGGGWPGVFWRSWGVGGR